MRINFTLSKSIARPAALALLAVCLSQPPVRAQETTERVLMSAPFGVARDQSVRLTLFVPDGANASGHVKLFDGRGSSVAESAEVRVSGGAFHSFHFEPGDIDLTGEDGSGRRELRASCWVRVDGPWQRMDDPVATLEIIQVSNGITDGASNTVLVGERPPSQGGSGRDDFMVGIGTGQSLRFSAFLDPDTTGSPEPISTQAKVYDESGNIIAVSRQLEILPGQFGWVSFNYNDLSIEGERGTGRKQVRLGPFFDFKSNRFSRVLASYETVDNSTGKTVWTYIGSVKSGTNR